jgi:hypothetical protein
MKTAVAQMKLHMETVEDESSKRPHRARQLQK